MALATAAFLMPLTPTPNPLFPPPLEWEVTISDPFSSNGNGWPTFINKNDNCSVSTLGFQNDALLWSLDAEEGYWCSYYYYPDILSVSDFDTSLDIKRSSGSGKADFGIVFRVNEAGYYIFVISDTTQTFQVRRMLNDASTTLEAWKKEPAISSDGTNRLAVSARGNVFYFYINDTLVDTIEDSEIDSGHIGIISEIYDGGEVSISYDNFLLQGIPSRELVTTLRRCSKSPSPSEFQPSSQGRIDREMKFSLGINHQVYSDREPDRQVT